MTRWLSHRMVERGIIKEEEQELYQFGIRNGMILLLNVVTALVIGLLTEQLAVVAVFTLSFMVLRSYTGGYHSDGRIFCYLGSNLVLLVPVYTQAVFYKTSLAWLLAVLLVSAALELAVLGILWYAGQIPYAYAVYTGICITALFMLVGKAQLWIQSHTEKHTENG